MRVEARGFAFIEGVTIKSTANCDKLLRVLLGFLDRLSESKGVTGNFTPWNTENFLFNYFSAVRMGRYIRGLPNSKFSALAEIICKNGEKNFRSGSVYRSNDIHAPDGMICRASCLTLTTSFNETLRKKLQESAGFCRALLKEAVAFMISGDVETGKSLLRKYINGTVGFVKLGEALDRSPKVLMRMFSAKGNPQAKNLFEIVAYLQKAEGTVLEVVERAA